MRRQIRSPDTWGTIPGVWFYVSDKEKKGDKKGKPDQKSIEKTERSIRCGHCDFKITSPGHKMEFGGSFEHTFMNPDGRVFRIGCFEQAEGCFVTGESRSEWTWFQGYSWRVALCGQCMTHLGWSYESEKGGHFFGLILDALN